MEKIFQLSDFEILPFDFEDFALITESIKLLNSNSNKNKQNIEFWRWRYNENPFAKSLGWYAKEKDTKEIAAILLFWPWKYYYNSKEYLFYQAIDGITNKKYQKIGIFLAVNKTAMDFFSRNNYALFGIPNGQSYPTYRKLKWETIERINPYLIPLSPVKTLIRYIFRKSIKPEIELQDHRIKPLNVEIEESNKINTIWTEELINWRFVKHPYFKYYTFVSNDSKFIFKTIARGNLIEAQIMLSNIDETDSFTKFKKFLKKHHVDILSYYGSNTKLIHIINNSIYKIKQKKILYLVLKDLPELHGIPFRFEQAERDTT